MKLFLRYLAQKRRIFAAAALFLAIFSVIFYLCHLPMLVLLYPVCLCTLLGVILLIIDFLRVKRRHMELTDIRTLTDLINLKLPDALNIEEEDCYNIIRLIAREYNSYREQTERRYSDMTDYYTVWVHQIKTPISSMHLNLQNEDSALSRRLSADLFRIEQYVEMVLTFIRLDSESTDYVIKEYDLDSIVRQEVKKFAGEFIGRKLTLEYAPLCTTVLTDEKWLSFVIGQVLSNALKYTPSGSISITLEPEKKLCIRDTGIGIAAEDIPRIFENGFTGYNGRVDKHASGIGLYLCRRICTGLGHSITAHSAPDRGTLIVIDLERKKLEVE